MNYRSLVGPEDKYDIIGALQFKILTNLGLRDYHYLLDVGCGSLRGGRLFMVYLKQGRYYGVEKYASLVAEGLNKETGLGIISAKKPTFRYTDGFNLSFGSTRFDFILAQSILSHATKTQMTKIIKQVRKNMKPSGKFVFTYFKGSSDYNGDTWAQAPDARYTRGFMEQALKTHGWMSYKELDYSHPSGQTWVLAQYG